MSVKLLADDHSELDILLNNVFATTDSEDASTLLKNLDLFWARLAVHIRAEHLQLFPAVLRVAESMRGDEPAPLIDRLKADHDLFMREMADLVKAARLASESGRKPPTEMRARLEAIRDRLAEHDRLEEEEVYTLAERLPADEAAALLDRIRQELENLPPRLDKKK